MSKVIKISDELYEKLEETAFQNGVRIQHLADALIEKGISACKADNIEVLERGRMVKIYIK